jgi:hypothetical protein
MDPNTTLCIQKYEKQLISLYHSNFLGVILLYNIEEFVAKKLIMFIPLKQLISFHHSNFHVFNNYCKKYCILKICFTKLFPWSDKSYFPLSKSDGWKARWYSQSISRLMPSIGYIVWSFAVVFEWIGLQKDINIQTRCRIWHSNTPTFYLYMFLKMPHVRSDKGELATNSNFRSSEVFKTTFAYNSCYIYWG